MSIRARLIVTLSVCLIVAYCSIVLIALASTRKSAEESFRDLAVSQLSRVEENIKTFLYPGEMSAKYLASLPVIKNSRGRLSSYMDTTETTTLLYANYPPYQRRIYDEFIRIARSNENFNFVFMANDDGGYAQAPEGDNKPPGYDPRRSPWYIESVKSGGEVAVVSPYVTSGGVLVCSVMVKTRDMSGEPLGLVGINYSLRGLTENMRRPILKTGYFVAYDPGGRLMIDGRRSEHEAMAPSEYPEFHKALSYLRDGDFRGRDENGEYIFGVTRTIDGLGWKLAVIFSRGEVMSASKALLTDILVMSGTIFILAFFAF